MSKQEAIEFLRFHSDFNEVNSFMYCIRKNSKVEDELFHKIMNCIITISNDTLNNEEIKSIYSIIFWCRSWSNTGVLDNMLDIASKEKLLVYLDIIENSLYYLLEENVEDAFWAYNEFLDGRYD